MTQMKNFNNVSVYLNANLKIHLVLKIKMIWFRIHDNEVNNIPEYNLLHYLINPPKHTKHLNSHYSPILHGCMNTKRAKQSLRTLNPIL